MMSDINLLAGKDPVGKSRIGSVVSLVACGLPVVLGVYGAQAIDSLGWSVTSVIAGFVSALLLMWLLGDRLPPSSMQFLSKESAQAKI
ncbi:MAG: hypothetical protein HOI66_18725 [Verrucomicrobia bacterium]|jgi:hypothetical protein|nr:hypothetical protein [Verrucomicrobiota bacterium]